MNYCLEAIRLYRFGLIVLRVKQWRQNGFSDVHQRIEDHVSSDHARGVLALQTTPVGDHPGNRAALTNHSAVLELQNWHRAKWCFCNRWRVVVIMSDYRPLQIDRPTKHNDNLNPFLCFVGKSELAKFVIVQVEARCQICHM